MGRHSKLYTTEAHLEVSPTGGVKAGYKRTAVVTSFSAEVEVKPDGEFKVAVSGSGDLRQVPTEAPQLILAVRSYFLVQTNLQWIRVERQRTAWERDRLEVLKLRREMNVTPQDSSALSPGDIVEGDGELIVVDKAGVPVTIVGGIIKPLFTGAEAPTSV